MPFEQGTISFRICKLPADLPDNAIELMQANAAQSLDYVNEEPQWGWVSPRHLLDCNITEETCKIAGFYHVCLRQAERKIPSSLLNAECKLEELSKLAATGATRLSKKERKAIKEEVQKHLISQMPPTLSGIYCVIDPIEHLLFTTAVSLRALDIFISFFHKTFGFDPIPLIPQIVSSEMYGIDPDDVPGICISPVLKREAGEGNGSLGENFLTWLWFYQEECNGTLPPNDLGEFGFMIDGPLSFVSEGNGAFESVIRKGVPTVSAEAKAALMVGKKLKSAKFILAKDENQEWSCMVDANEFTFRGLKMPEGEAMEPANIFEERMTNLFNFHSIFFALFEKFLKDTSNPQKQGDYQAKAREWVQNREER